MQHENLAKLVNGSGFLFQVAVEDHLRKTTGKHKWEIVAHEYQWSSSDRARSGFIDFIAARGNFRCVFECKRTQGGEWIFLVPECSQETDELRTLWSCRARDSRRAWGWDNLRFRPTTLRSEFCIVRGASDDDKPMLERISGDLVKASESLAREELEMRERRKEVALYIPVIVTNATLYTCRVEPGSVDLSTGMVPSSAQFNRVSAIRFRKSLASDLVHDPETYDSIAEGQLKKERSTFVVHVSDLAEWLAKVEEVLPDPLFMEPYPWHYLQA
jgi:hypothetical protein